MAHLQLGRVLTVALSLLVVAPPSLNQSLPGCNSTCGNVSIPYPFGTGYSSSPDQKPCFLERKFNVSCNYSESQLIWGNIPVINITVQTHQMDVRALVSRFCDSENYLNPRLTTIRSNFSISSRENKFVTVGCDSYGYLDSEYNKKLYSTGCLTRCYGNELIDDATCSGIGCCRMDIPNRMRDITVKASNFPNSTEYNNNCSYSFVVKQDEYKFSATHLRRFPDERLPLVLDWTVGNTNCSVAKSTAEYACRQSSHCDDKDSDYGYRCICDDGYEGNPYIGCTDIDECKTQNHTCISENNCNNSFGNYTCFCHKWWQSGNGRKEGGCHVHTMIVIGAGVGAVILFVGVALLYFIYQKKKFIKLKDKFFEQNGGLILLQKLSRIEDSSQTKLFTEKQLKEATNNFDETLIIGKGGSGTVFKGFLADNRIVAIKKSKTIDESQKEEFINEVIVLSQINHRNVVKLLGCCLETKVPLLVYEFVNKGTLFDYLHKEGNEANVCWKSRLRIASEAAGALSYLHSAASIPIIHGDVKSANILLDDNYTAKVSDFGASRLVQLDQIEIARGVPGTFGYIDPEAIQTNQLSEKSDVYSFGVVLVELLTGEQPYPACRPEEKRSLAMHFLSCLREDRLLGVLQDGILNEENKQEIMEVAILAAECLKLKGEERPSMKEVAMELEGRRRMTKHPWINTYENPDETEYLLREAASSNYEHGDGNSHQCSGYDSIKDHVLIALDDGR